MRHLVAALALAHIAAAQPAEFVVSPSGNDRAPGTKSRPFATIARAQQAACTHAKARPVTVTLRGGTYSLAEALVFTPADSGSEGNVVTYRSQPGEAVMLSGGQRLTGFAKQGQFWVATVPAATGRAFNQLYVNGHRRPRARTPNVGRYHRIQSKLPGKQEARQGFRFATGDVQQWHNREDVVVVVLASWYNTIHHIKSIDFPQRTVWFTNPAARPFGWYETNLRYYVENIAEGLDEPGEWYLDRQTGVLKYYPLPGEDIATAEIVAPVVKQTLVRFQGDPEAGQYVEYVRLSGLQIRHTDAYLPKDLYDARQAATVQDAALQADGARHCAVLDCEIANTGEHGIWFRDACHDNTIERCHVHDLGGGGIYIGEKWRWGNDCPGWPGYRSLEEVPHTTERNVVDNCFVHDGCHLFTGAVGIWLGQASHTRVSHNEICDMTYSGISLGWDWSGHPSTAHHNLIEHNHIHHLGHGRMNDMAGIYTLGVSPGTIIRNNLIHDVTAYQSSVGYALGAGIYLDQSSGEITIRDNVCYDLCNAGFFLHFGTNNRLENNFFADLQGLGPLGWGLEFTARRNAADKGNVATHNIVCAQTGKAAKATLGGKARPGTDPYEFVTVDRNLYFSPTDRKVVFGTDHSDTPGSLVDLAKWRESGYDRDSVVADPGFVDAAAHDYRLRPDSPALALGIRSVDVSQAGLHGDPAWVALPRTVTMRPPDPPSPFKPRSLLFLDEDFEQDPVGFVPDHVQFTDAKKGAVVEVTDQQAATGSKSLRFVNTPGLKQDYYPNRVWSGIRLDKGKVAIRFDCMNSPEQPANFWIELRDWTGRPLQAGPSLKIAPDGTLTLDQGPKIPFTPGQWYRVEIDFALGGNAPREYRLRITPQGGEPRQFSLPLNPAFQTLTWFGFIAIDGDRRSTFYVDNLHVDME